MQRSRALLVGVFFLAVGPLTPARAEEEWADFHFLIGTWVSEGTPEQGSGSFSLEPDLRGKVLVRRNTAYVPTTTGGLPAKHEDLMVVYPDRGGKQFRASYFDSEGRVIHYSVSSLPAAKGLVFLSEADRSGPRFRLTYAKVEGDRVAVKFEIAPPGPKGQFRTYLQGTVRRNQPGK
jgi:hypothetical protein